MSLRKTIEKVISLTVVATTANASQTIALPLGKITHVVAFFRDYSGINPGFVRASIKDANGAEVSQMQSIDNYATRQGGDYTSSKKPLPVDGGNNFTVTVQATANFTANFLVDFVFIYEDQEENC